MLSCYFCIRFERILSKLLSDWKYQLSVRHCCYRSDHFYLWFPIWILRTWKAGPHMPVKLISLHHEHPKAIKKTSGLALFISDNVHPTHPQLINDINLTEETQELLNYCHPHKFCTYTLKRMHTHKFCMSQAFSYALIPPGPFPSSLVQQGTRKWFKFKHLLYIYI